MDRLCSLHRLMRVLVPFLERISIWRLANRFQQREKAEGRRSETSTYRLPMYLCRLFLLLLLSARAGHLRDDHLGPGGPWNRVVPMAMFVGVKAGRSA